MFEDEAEYIEETKTLFDENPRLEAKIGKLKSIVELLLQIVNEDEGITFSFVVFKGFKELGEKSVKAYRGLKELRQVKSSFVPDFDDKKIKM